MFLLALFTSWVPVATAPRQERPVPASGLVLTAEQLEPSPLPNQAVRVRLTLTNHGTEAVGPLPALRQSIVVAGVLAEEGGGKSYYVPRAAVVAPGRTSAASVDEGPLTLEPGGSSTVAFAFAAEWGRDVRPFFPAAGKYRVRLEYAAPGRSVQADPLEVEVLAPGGADAEAAAQLNDDPALRRAMMAPSEIPSASLRRSLERIERLDLGRTTYADYARLALARMDLSERTSQGTDSAVAYLEAIRPERFAYGAQALVLLTQALAEGNRRSEVVSRLEREYGDSIECLEHRSKSSRANH